MTIYEERHVLFCDILGFTQAVTDGKIGNYILDDGAFVNDSTKRQACALEIEFTPEMRLVPSRDWLELGVA